MGEPCYLLHGDHRVLLPGVAAASIELTITSPSYNKGQSRTARAHPYARRGSGLDWRGYGPDPDALPHPEYVAGQMVMLQALYRVTVPGGSLCYQHVPRWDGERLIHPVEWLADKACPWTLRQEIVWVKGGDIERGQTVRWDGWHFPPGSERIYWLTKGPWRGGPLPLAMRRWRDVWVIPPDRSARWHPAPFPLALAARLVAALSRPGDLVCDPCAGSGTVGEAALRAGRRFLGIERVGAYVRRAMRRLANVETL